MLCASHRFFEFVMQMVNRKSQHILAGFSSEEASAKWIETEKKTWSGKGLDMKNAFLNRG
jgi:hypothetical protein